MKNVKRLVSLLLAVVMIVGTIPFAYAADVTADNSVQVETSEAVIDTAPTVETGAIEAVDPSEITPEMVETVLESSGVSASPEAIEEALTEVQTVDTIPVGSTETTVVPVETETEETVSSETVAETIQAELETTEPAIVEADPDVTSTEAYILANMNPAYVGAGDKLLPFDMLNVKHTMADRNVMNLYNLPLTIDGLWSDRNGNGVADHPEAFIMQQSAYMMLYITSPESEYAVAYVDTMNSDTTKVVDTLFGVNNDEGELLDGYIYDKETGLVYVPVQYLQTLDDDGNVVFGHTQIQMLYAVNTTCVDNVYTETTTTVNVEISTNRIRGDVAETGTADISIIDDAISLQIAENDRALNSITEDSIASVQVNGYEADYVYDEDTGVLTVDANASTTDTVSVELENPGLLESAGMAIVDFFTVPASAYVPGNKIPFDEVGFTNDDCDNGVYGATWEFSEMPKLGDTIVITTNQVKYQSSSSHYDDTTGQYDSGYGNFITAGGHCEENMVWAIINEGYTTTGVTLENRWTFYPNEKGFYRQYMLYIPAGTYTDPASGLSWTITVGPDEHNEAAAGMSGFIGSLNCVHIGVSADLTKYSTSTDSYNNSIPGNNKWFDNDTTDVRMTICQVSVSDNGKSGYIMVGFLIPTHDSQAGCSFYKIQWTMDSGSGSIQIRKQNQNGYPRNGAIFTATNLDTGDVYTIGPTNDSGYAIIRNVSVGRYEVVETQAPIGCKLDTTKYTGTVVENSTLPLSFTIKDEEPDVTLKKITSVGPLSGWQLNIWCTADNGRNNGAYVQSDASGNFYMMNAKDLTHLPSKQVVQTDPKRDSNGNLIYKVYGFTDGQYKVREFARNDIDADWSLSEIRIRCYDANGNLLGDTNGDGISILVPSSAITEDVHNKIVSSGSDDDIVYSESNEKVTDYIASFNSNGLFARSDSITWEVVNEGDTGKLNIIKTTNTGSVQGWQFEIYSNANCTTKVGGPYTTDANGNIAVDLEHGTYYVKETGHTTSSVWSSAYLAADTRVQSVTLTSGSTNSVTFKNNFGGKISVPKNTNTGGYLANWEFTVYSNSACTTRAKYLDGTTVEVLKTDSTGWATTSGILEPGTYYVKETGGTYANSSWWTNDTSTVSTVTVTANTTTKIPTNTFVNKMYGQISVTKTTNTKEDLSGWVFTIYTNSACTTVAKDKDGNNATITTDANGKGTSKLLEPGTYYVKETGGTYFSNAYWKNDTSHVETVVVTAMATATASYTWNNIEYGRISLNKVTNTNADLGGWVFTVYTDAACKTVAKDRDGKNATLTTDANGDATSGYLLPGTYYVKETGGTDFDDDYWVTDSQVQTVVVKKMAVTPLAYDFENTHYARIDLVKEMATDGPLNGWKFVIYEDKNCTKVAKMIPDTNKPATEVNAELTTNANGYAISGYLLPGKTYYVKEIIDETSGLYFCKTTNPVPVTIGLGDAGKDIRVQSGTKTNVSFINALRPIEIEVLKVDPSNKPLASVTFKLEWYDETAGAWKPVKYSSKEDVVKGYTNASGLNANGELVTNANGLVVFTNLYPLVDYRLTETATVDGMLLLKDSVLVRQNDVPMTPTGNTAPYTRHYEVTVVNYPIYPLTEAGVSDWTLNLMAGVGAFFATAIAAFIVYDLIRKKKRI